MSSFKHAEVGPCPLPERIGRALRLAEAGEAALCLPAGTLRQVVQQVLGADQRGPGRSGINHDEVPLQLVLSLGPDTCKARLLMDPALGAPTAHDRFKGASAAIAQSFTRAGQAGFLPHVGRFLSDIGPDETCAADQYSYGVLWLGEEVQGPGRAIYLDTSVKSAAQSWADISHTFCRLAGDGGHIDATLGKLREIAAPASAGLEARAPHCRLKLHSRLTCEPAVGALADIAPMLATPAVLKAIAALMERSAHLSLHGFVLETAFLAKTGQMSDAKIDLAVQELWPASVAFRRAQDVAEALAVTWPAAVIQTLEEHAKLSYLGIGQTANGTPRLNLYLKALPVS